MKNLFLFLLLPLGFTATAQTIRQPAGAQATPSVTFSADDNVRFNIANDIAINLVEGKFNLVTNNFDTNLKANLKEDLIRSSWYQGTSWRGTFTRIETIARGQEQGLATINVVCRFSNAYLLVVAVFKEKQVAALYLR